MILARGANHDLVDSNGNSVTHILVVFDNMRMFDLAVECGASINIKNKLNMTPLTVRIKSIINSLTDQSSAGGRLPGAHGHVLPHRLHGEGGLLADRRGLLLGLPHRAARHHQLFNRDTFSSLNYGCVQSLFRGHAQMTSAVGGGEGFGQNLTQ